MEKLPELKNELSSLVISNPKVMSLAELSQDYEEFIGRPIPFQDHGHGDLLSFITRECADIFTFSGPPFNPNLFPVVNKKVNHLNKMILKQKKKPVKKTIVSHKTKNFSRIDKWEPIAVPKKKVFSPKKKDAIPKGNIPIQAPSVSNKENVIPKKILITPKKASPKKGSYVPVEMDVMSPKKLSADRVIEHPPLDKDYLGIKKQISKSRFEQFVFFNPKIGIPTLNLVDDLIGSSVYIVVCHIKNPFKFWFRFDYCGFEGGLNHLMSSMKEYYGKSRVFDLSVPPSLIKLDMYYVVDFARYYYRIIVTDIMGESTVKVYFIDYGFQEVVSVDNLKYLMKQFSELPAQAIRGCQTGIEPTNGVYWDIPSIRKFSDFMKDETITAHVEDIDIDNVVKLKIDVRGRSMEANMIDKGYANPERKPKNTRRRRSYVYY